MSLDIILTDGESGFVKSWNITHNLGKMASKAGLYYPLWRPGEMGVDTAGELIHHLRRGVRYAYDNQQELNAYAPRNEWGSLRLLLDVAEEYLDYCRKYPAATIFVSR